MNNQVLQVREGSLAGSVVSIDDFQRACRGLESLMLHIEVLNRVVTEVGGVARAAVQLRLEDRAKLLRCRVRDIRPQVRTSIEKQVDAEVWAPAVLTVLRDFSDKVRAAVGE